VALVCLVFFVPPQSHYTTARPKDNRHRKREREIETKRSKESDGRVCERKGTKAVGTQEGCMDFILISLFL